MSMTTKDDVLSPQVFIEHIKGHFKNKPVFVNSPLVTGGAVIIDGNMVIPGTKSTAVGKTVDVPYFGLIGDFADNPDGSSVTPGKLSQTSEQATVSRQSLAVEASAWSQGVLATNPNLGNLMDEATRQAEEAVQRMMSKAIVTAISTTPLVNDKYSSGSPSYISYDDIIDATSMWGDEQDDIVGLVAHSQVRADLAKLKDSTGKPLLLTSMNQGPGQMMTFAGIPILLSNSVPLTGSTPGAVTSTGTSPPVCTLAGTPLGAWKLHIDCQASHASTTTVKFSTDNGKTWSAAITVADDSVPVALIDTTVDSLVGKNGLTGLTAAFAAGDFNVDNLWKSTMNLKATTLILQKGAAAFYYSADHLVPKTDVDILADSDILAMHCYHVAHMYRRRRGGSYPGVVALQTNVTGYIG